MKLIETPVRNLREHPIRTLCFTALVLFVALLIVI